MVCWRTFLLIVLAGKLRVCVVCQCAAGNDFPLQFGPPASFPSCWCGLHCWHETCEFLWRPGPWIGGSSGNDDFDGFFTRALVRQDRGLDDLLSGINNNRLAVMMERQQRRYTQPVCEEEDIRSHIDLDIFTLFSRGLCTTSLINSHEAFFHKKTFLLTWCYFDGIWPIIKPRWQRAIFLPSTFGWQKTVHAFH